MRPGWPPYVLVCLLGVAAPLAADLLPRITFRNGDPRRRVTSFQEKGVLHFDTFLPSTDGETLYVGARDTLLALGTGKAGSFELKGKILWKATSSKTEDCVFKKNGNETGCFNFIRVLVQLNETHLYTCGTYAFSPSCAYIHLEAFSMAKDKNGDPILEEGRGVSPFDPRLQSTALVVDGELYAGTMSDFLGSDPVISRTLGSRTRLKTETFLTWLYSDAAFVASFNIPIAPDSEKVYFFFSETSNEVNYFGRLTVSRVARVCKNDVGGDKVLQKKWTTFLKAPLSCSKQGQFPYTVVQHVFVLPQLEGGGAIFYGVFASQWQTGNAGSSAVCAFDLSTIRDAFEGKYKEFHKDCLQWVTYGGPTLSPRPGSCSVSSSADRILDFTKGHPLMDETILPTHKQPLLVKEGVKYTRIAAHQAGSISGTTYNVLFLGTDRGALHKAVVVGSGAHIIEAVQLFAEEEPVRNLLLSPEKAVLYVGYSQGVLQVPLANCSLYMSCASCVLARDPYCAWDRGARQCKNTRSAKEDVGGWLQDVETGNAKAKCPLVSGRTSGSSDDSDVTTLTPILASLVRLSCPRSSSLANYTWTYPSNKLPSGLIMELGPDLVVVAHKATLGTYACQASENGYLQTVARYRLLFPHVPHFRTKLGPPKEGQPRSQAKQRSYWAQFVTVTVLLSMTLAVVVAVAAFSYRSRLRGKGKVQGCGTPEASKAARQERIPLNSSLFPPPHSTSHQGQESAADAKTEGGALQDTSVDVQRFGLAEKEASRGAATGV